MARARTLAQSLPSRSAALNRLSYPEMMRSADLRQELPPLLRLAAPLILGELGWIAMSVVDTAMLGRLPDSAIALSASALAQVLFNTAAFGVGGVLLGLDTLLSQALGAGEPDEANHWFGHGIVLAVAAAALLIAVVAGMPVLLSRLPVEPAVLSRAIPALRGLDYGVLPLMLYFTFRRYLQAAHQVRLIAFALVTANLVNVAGDWLLIYGHRWSFGSAPTLTVSIPAFGVTGSAWSTSFARLYLMAILAIALWRADRQHRLGLRSALGRQFRRRDFQWSAVRRLLALGVPAGAQIFVEIAIFALVTTLIATFGPLPLAGHEVALQCASTTFMVPFAISGATAVRVGHALGRIRAGSGTIAEAEAAGWSGICAGGLFMLVSSGALLLFPHLIARLFTPNPDVIQAAVPLLLVAAGFQFVDGLQITATGALRGAGRTASPFWIQLFCYWAVGMPLGVWLAFNQKRGAVGLWLGLLLALAGAAAALLLAWRRESQTFSSAAA